MPATAASTASRTRSIAFCGLSVALMAVSAWITVPFGPVPFTLQTFVMVFVLLALMPKQAIGSVAAYLAMGAVGLPVFSSMRGGIGVLAGPTGGFVWGFLLGTAVAVGFLALCAKLGKTGENRPIALDICAALIFEVVIYLCGWFQLMGVANMSPAAAFAAAVAPFIIIDVIKMVAAVFTARAVRKAIR